MKTPTSERCNTHTMYYSKGKGKGRGVPSISRKLAHSISSHLEKYSPTSRPPQPNFYSPHRGLILHPLQLNSNFHVIYVFSCSHCSCTIFILTSYSLYTQIIFILIDIQYLQKVVFSFEKGSNGQNH